MRALALLLALGLCACATAPTRPAIVQCLPLKPYTTAEQAQVAKELEALPADSRLAGFIADYGAMRAADRACMGG